MTTSSVTPQRAVYQLFQPMGGVRARPLSRAWAGVTDSTNAPATAATVTASRANRNRSPGRLLHCSPAGALSHVPAALPMPPRLRNSLLAAVLVVASLGM